MKHLAIALLMAGSLSTSGCGLQADIPAAGGTVFLTPSPAPAISAKTVAGAGFSLTSLRGHPAVVDFFGSWCGPCRAQQNELNKLAAQYQSRHVTFVGVAMRDDATAVTGYQQDYAVPYPAVLDNDGSIAGNYNIVAPPTLVVIDSQGRMVAKYLATVSGLSTELDGLLSN